MPLVVPALRLAMLFLNIYDTYKFLKPPLPSTRNANKPTLRSVTQRKRNMKGCLSVWIVWCCYVVYERLPEPLVSVFIPFYDELKSLVIIFLILTRARGAEPIYLHIIRPFLKPHTETLDSILDFTFLVLDIALATFSAPVIAGKTLWNRIFGRGDSESDDEISIKHSNETAPNRNIPHEVSSFGSQVPRPTNGIYGTNSVHSAYIPFPEPEQPVSVGTASPKHTHQHEIWYPPPSAYLVNEDDNGLSQPDHQRTSTSDSDLTLIQETQIDEWRQYPKCPAAYPPTPLVTKMHVTAKSADAYLNVSPEVDELPGQDFRQSLLPLSETTDPSSDGDLSDEKPIRGVYAVSATGDTAMFVDTDAEDNTMDEEEEDEFNITLQTPPPTRQLDFFQPIGVSSPIFSLEKINSHYQSTRATTAYNGSSLRPRSSLDSVSTAMSDEELPTIGKKRPLPLSRSSSNLNTKIAASQGLGLDTKQRVVGDEIKRNRQASFVHSSGDQKHRDDGNKTSEVKKRKLGSPKRPVRTSRPIRSRLNRAVSPPIRPERKPVTEQRRPLSQRYECAGFVTSNKPAASSTNIVARSSRNKSLLRQTAVSRGQES